MSEEGLLAAVGAKGANFSGMGGSTVAAKIMAKYGFKVRTCVCVCVCVYVYYT